MAKIYTLHIHNQHAPAARTTQRIDIQVGSVPQNTQTCDAPVAPPPATTLREEVHLTVPKSPRVTPAMVESAIAEVAYHHFVGTTKTVCCLTLTNGFTVTGESACLLPADFDTAIGQQLALADAKRRVTTLMAYSLTCVINGI